MTDKTKAEQALDLWKEWFDWSGNPDIKITPCRICLEIFGHECFDEFYREPHEPIPDCVFIRAWQLIKSLED